MKRRLLNLISVFVVSCYIAGCAVKTPDSIKNDPFVSGTSSVTVESTEATITTEARGHFEFKPVVISSIFRDIMGEDMYQAYCNYIKAVQNGEDSFEVKDEHTYDWMIGQFPCQLQPLYYIYTESSYGGAFKDGRAKFQYKISKEELAAKEAEFEKLVTDILNENLRDDYSDFEKALALYLYISNNYTYDYESFEKMKDDTSMVFSAYKFLTRKTGICSECSTAYSYFLLQAGVDATVAGGNNYSGEGHEWSYLTINGKNYHVDPTYVMGRPNCLSYFMMTDEQRELEDGFKKEKTSIACHYKEDHNGSKYDANDDFFAPLWGGTLTSWDHKKKLIYYTDMDGNNKTFDYSKVG
ncbi:MAG: transglutaminase-like domain-containing protein [Saccharofermentans sp.]|nr:transglutaminase-like domain-containing protein [Saccharofermentans sp.]